MVANRSPRLAVGLLHYPILDREKRIIATNITNFDIHDIARASRVFGVENYFLIHPMQDQLMFVERVLDHWRVGAGAQFNPSRRKALVSVKTAESLPSALAQWGVPGALVIATHARPVGGAQAITFKELRKVLHEELKPCFLLFGTGSGMTDEFMQNCDYVLESIRGAPPDDFRHLSVRSAVSICLDRLMGAC